MIASMVVAMVVTAGGGEVHHFTERVKDQFVVRFLDGMNDEAVRKSADQS